VSRFREPTDGGAWGVKIRSLKSRPEPSEELGMFLKDRAWDVLVNILPALDSGRIVVMDRYILSSVSCQGAAGLPPCEILKKNLGFPWPDLTVILDVSPAEGLARIRKGRPGGAAPAFENPVYLEKVRETLGMAKSLPGVELVDGRISRERLAGMLLALAEPAARLKIRRPAP
jgi:dTMP kinase